MNSQGAILNERCAHTAMIGAVVCRQYGELVHVERDVVVDRLEAAEQKDEDAENDVEAAGGDQQPVATSRYRRSVRVAHDHRDQTESCARRVTVTTATVHLL